MPMLLNVDKTLYRANHPETKLFPVPRKIEQFLRATHQINKPQRDAQQIKPWLIGPQLSGQIPHIPRNQHEHHVRRQLLRQKLLEQITICVVILTLHAWINSVQH